ncbi:MAG: hypothetical protein IH625_13045 [Rhodobacteraceae bacterium]|nr:hypothetical protein [Paracoccaceae bacterium]
MEQMLLAVGLVCATLSSRVVLLAARGGIFAEMAARQSFAVQLLGALTLPAQIALLVAGFFFFVWWQWVAIVLASLFIFGAMVGRSTWGAFASIRPLLDLIAVASAVVVWASYFQLIAI